MKNYTEHENQEINSYVVIYMAFHVEYAYLFEEQFQTWTEFMWHILCHVLPHKLLCTSSKMTHLILYWCVIIIDQYDFVSVFINQIKMEKYPN